MSINKQIALNLAVTGLLAQGEKAMAADACVYLAENGNRCAVGMMIDPAKYNPEVEGGSVEARAAKLNRMLLPEVGIITTDEDLDFLSDVQTYLHDRITPLTDTEIPRDALIEEATHIAEQYGLTVNLEGETA